MGRELLSSDSLILATSTEMSVTNMAWKSWAEGNLKLNQEVQICLKSELYTEILTLDFLIYTCLYIFFILNFFHKIYFDPVYAEFLMFVVPYH